MTAYQSHIKIAIDPGFGGIKIAWFDDAGQPHTLVIPSVVGLGQITDLSMLGLGRQRKTARPLTVEFAAPGVPPGNGNGLGALVRFLVGENVHRHGEPIEDLDYLRLSQGQVSQALLYAALGSALNSNGHSPSPRPLGRPEGGPGVRAISLMFGFPVEIMKDKPLAQSHLRGLRAWSIGSHCFTIDGRPVQVEILQVKAIAQPVGSYLEWGLDDAGQWGREKAALQKPIGVADIGFNTVDLFSVENAEIVDRFTAGDTLGMHRVAQAIQRHVRERHAVKWSMHQADTLVRHYLAGRGAYFNCADGEIDLSGIVRQALDQTTIDINEYIRARWGNGRQFYKLIITGGGAQALRDTLLRHYPTAYLPPDPVTANARGLLKWAQRSFKDVPMPGA